MDIITNTIKRQTLEKFADEHGLTMVVNERDPSFTDDSRRWYASFKHVEIKGDGTLISTFGNGYNRALAVEAYFPQISGKLIVVNAGSADRREINVPILTGAK